MTALPPRCAGCNCDAPAVTDPEFAVVAHGQPGNPGVLQPELEALAARGAKVLVNDLGPAPNDKNKKAADVVVEEITKNGGEAMAN
mgnify:CR=1 FL=1